MKWTGKAARWINRIIGAAFLLGAVALLIQVVIRLSTGQTPTWGLLTAFVMALIGAAAIEN